MQRNSTLSVEDVTRILQLVLKVSEAKGLTPSDVIQGFIDLHSERQPMATRLNLHVAEFVSRMRRIRLKRNDVAGASLFRDPAWDMLLELYCAHHQHRELSISSLCYSSGVPLSTALRQLARLEDHELLERIGDTTDMRRCWVRATPKGLDLVGATILELIDTFHLVQHSLGEAG